jgi:hypothetical protein
MQIAENMAVSLSTAIGQGVRRIHPPRVRDAAARLALCGPPQSIAKGKREENGSNGSAWLYNRSRPESEKRNL